MIMINLKDKSNNNYHANHPLNHHHHNNNINNCKTNNNNNIKGPNNELIKVKTEFKPLYLRPQ